MVDAMRKQLDALMGTDRNGGPTITKSFTDPDICTSYLVGLCPHELFNNTKMDLGECPKVHSVHLKTEYEEARKKKDYGYDYNVEMQLQRYVEDCDRKIKRNIKHLEDVQAPDPEDKAIIQQVKELMDTAERLGEEGKVEESLEYIQKAEDLKAKKSDMTAAAASIIAQIPSVPEGGPTASQHQKLRVCDVSNTHSSFPLLLLFLYWGFNIILFECEYICAAYLSLYDSDKRLSDHFGGKLHIGYLTLREKYKELKDNRLKQREDRLQYISYSTERSYHDRSSYQVGDVDDSFERDLERIRQRQREKQRREQEDDEPNRDRDRPPPRSRDSNSPPSFEDYEPPRRGGGSGGGRNERSSYSRRERIDYDRPQEDSYNGYDNGYDRPSGRNYNNSRYGNYERRDYDRPEREYRDYDRPEREYRDYDRPPARDYDRPRRNYRDYDQPEERNYDRDYEEDRNYNDKDGRRDDRDYDRGYDRVRDYDDRDRDRDSDRGSEGEIERDRDYDRPRDKEYSSRDYDRPRDDADDGEYKGSRDYDRRSYDRDTQQDRDYDRDRNR